MEIAIREIERQDYPTVTALFAEEIWGKRGANELYSDRVARFFEETKDDEAHKTFVAEVDGCVVAFVSTFASSWIASRNLFIQCIAVEGGRQGKGVGTKLLRHVEEWAKVNGISGIGLQSGVQRTAAHVFYERNGYDRSNYFYKNF